MPSIEPTVERPDRRASPVGDDSDVSYRLIAEMIPQFVWTAGPDGALEYLNSRVHEYTGRTSETLAGWGWKDVVHPEEIERCIAAWTRALQTGERYEFEFRLRRADGVYRWHHASAVPLRDPSGHIARWFGTCVDIESDVRGAQILESMVEERTRELRESEASVRALMDRLVATQESERRRVAGELHDLIGQNLTALGIDLAALAQTAAPGPRLDGMRALLEETIGTIRGVMSALRPPELEEYGLVPALRWHAEDFGRRTGLKTTLQVSGAEARLPREAELALFRIAQEAMLNAAKHSGGSVVALGIAHHAGHVCVSIEDDGHGFANPVGARSARRGGWGLHLMRERAAVHGGALRVEFPGRGTRVVVELPRQTEARRAD